MDWLLYGDGGERMVSYTSWASNELQQRASSSVAPSSSYFNPSVQTALAQWIAESKTLA